MDRNDCRFVGRIGNKIKEGKTVTGGTFLWFHLALEARANASSTENNYHQNLNIMCFKKPVIDYLKRVNARPGNTVIIFGFVSTFQDEIAGKDILSTAINANEIYVVKTKADN